MCGRPLLREPAYSELANGRTIHYGPKCAALNGLIDQSGRRGTPAKRKPRRGASRRDETQLALFLPETLQTHDHD